MAAKAISAYTTITVQALVASSVSVTGQVTAGSTASPSKVILRGTPSQGLQMQLGDTADIGAVGVRFSTTSAFLASNARQTTHGVDTWAQSSGVSGSCLVDVSYNNGVAIRFANAGTANGNYATFWPTTTGVVLGRTASTFNGTVTVSNTLTASNGLTVSTGGVTVVAGTSTFQAVNATAVRVSGAISSIGASQAALDVSGGARLLTYGADASTNGTYSVISRRSDASNSIVVFSTDAAGAASIPSGPLTVNNQVIVGNVSGTPADGSIWWDGTNFKGRMGGVTKTFTLT